MSKRDTSHYLVIHKHFASIPITLGFVGLEVLATKGDEEIQLGPISMSPTLASHSLLSRKYSKTGFISPTPKLEGRVIGLCENQSFCI